MVFFIAAPRMAWARVRSGSGTLDALGTKPGYRSVIARSNLIVAGIASLELLVSNAMVRSPFEQSERLNL